MWHGAKHIFGGNHFSIWMILDHSPVNVHQRFMRILDNFILNFGLQLEHFKFDLFNFRSVVMFSLNKMQLIILDHGSGFTRNYGVMTLAPKVWFVKRPNDKYLLEQDLPHMVSVMAFGLDMFYVTKPIFVFVQALVFTPITRWITYNREFHLLIMNWKYFHVNFPKWLKNGI